VTDKGLERFLPAGVQKSYFMISDAERAFLNTALEKYGNVLKPALRLMTSYRLAIEEIKDSRGITSYTRWVDAVQLKGADEKEVYVTFSPQFERIWLESKKRLLEFAAQKPAAIRLRSKYAIRLYAWAKK
jgi:plasmid replication initiation protein